MSLSDAFWIAAAFAVIDDHGREDFGILHLLGRMPDIVHVCFK